MGMQIHFDNLTRRPRFSTSDDDASTPRGTPPLKVPERILPKRSAYVIYHPFPQVKRLSGFRAAKSFKPDVVIISSDSDEYGDTPRPGQNAKSRYDNC